MKRNTFLAAIVSVALLIALSYPAAAMERGITLQRAMDEDDTEALSFAAAILGGIPGCCIGTMCAPIIGPLAGLVLGALFLGLVVFVFAFVVVLMLAAIPGVILWLALLIPSALFFGAMFAFIGLIGGAAIGFGLGAIIVVIGILLCLTIIGAIIGIPLIIIGVIAAFLLAVFGAAVGAIGLGILGAVVGAIVLGALIFGAILLLAAVIALLPGLFGAGVGALVGGILGLVFFPIAGPLGGAVLGWLIMLGLMGSSESS